MKGSFRVTIAGAALLALAIGARSVWSHLESDRELAARVAATSLTRPDATVEPCPADGAEGVLVLLVLGQSNAANHGGAVAPARPLRSEQVTTFAEGQCVRSGDPLPGGTGPARSIWTGLQDALARHGIQRRIVVVPLAVDSTTIDDWTRSTSPLPARLGRLVDSMVASGLRPDFVLWQHGESDLRQGTSTEAYVAGFESLRASIRSRGVDAPMLLAKSTHCRNPAPESIRNAIDRLVASHADLRRGPDTDALTGGFRLADDCHFSMAGLRAAADLWAGAIAAQLP